MQVPDRSPVRPNAWKYTNTFLAGWRLASLEVGFVAMPPKAQNIRVSKSYVNGEYSA